MRFQFPWNDPYYFLVYSRKQANEEALEPNHKQQSPWIFRLYLHFPKVIISALTIFQFPVSSLLLSRFWTESPFRANLLFGVYTIIQVARYRSSLYVPVACPPSLSWVFLERALQTIFTHTSFWNQDFGVPRSDVPFWFGVLQGDKSLNQ